MPGGCRDRDRLFRIRRDNGAVSDKSPKQCERSGRRRRTVRVVAVLRLGGAAILGYLRLEYGRGISVSGLSGGFCPHCGKSYGTEVDQCPVHGFLFQAGDVLRPGTVIDGSYQILQRLGSGGMGETYLVKHTYLGEELVLKRVRSDLAEDPIYQQSFLREARALAALRKVASVVEVRHACQTREGYLALVLEYIEGGNLL